MTEQATILKAIKSVVKKLEPESELILFGSRARGDAKPNSDWDILILLPYPADLKAEQKFRHQLFELELKFEQTIFTLVKSRAAWQNTYSPLYENIKQEGIRL